MKTKVQIIQELLDSKKITAEDAVVLLTPEKEYVPVPQEVQPYKPFPLTPNVPYWQVDVNNPFATYSTAGPVRPATLTVD